MKKLFYALAVLIICAVFVSSNAPKNDASAAELNNVTSCFAPCNGIKVTTTEKIKARPDVAYIYFCIDTKNTNLESAKTENAKATSNLVSTLAELDISKDDIKTTGFYVFPEYDYFSGQKFLGYKVSNQLTVKTKDIENTGKIIDESLKCGANIVNGIQFSIEDYTSLYNTALLSAITSAKEKALEISKVINAEDIKVISITELSHNFYRIYEMLGYTKNFDGAFSTPIFYDDIEISATVELICEIVY